VSATNLVIPESAKRLSGAGRTRDFRVYAVLLFGCAEKPSGFDVFKEILG
jgi:hypothetical protein